MRLSNLAPWAMACVASANLIFGGSYPAGTLIQSFDFPDSTVNLADGSLIGSDQNPVAGVFSAALRLAEKGTTNAIGSFKLPDLDPGNVAKSFDAKFNVRMGTVTGALAGEGWSMNFGRIPEDNGTGEDGFAPLPGGLTIAWDTFDNGDDAPSIEVFIGGVSVTNFPKAFAFDPASRAVVIHWDSSGLDLSYDNRTYCLDLPTPGFAPGPGDRFAFSARTTLATLDMVLDNLKITTLALPVIDTGGMIISEFVANNSELEDEFADKNGWIELLNGSAAPIDLTGWYLTDSKKTLTKWRINGLTLNPYNYQVVFASGRDRQLSSTSFLHAGFTLARTGGYVALVRPDGTVASAHDYGPQEKNVSFGEKGVERARGYMYPASPGVVNTQEPAAASFSPDVQFSHRGGFIAAPVTVGLSVFNSPTTVIRYSLDRTEPGVTSPEFNNSIAITQFMTVRARAYTPGHLPGRVSSRTFAMMDGTLSNYSGSGKVFESNLPLVFVDSFGINVDGSTGGTRPFRPSYAMVIPPDPVTGRASLASTPDYAGPAGVHMRGESSAGFDQRSYTLEIWDESGKDLDVGLLGMPADSDWVLYGPWSEKTLMRNKLIFDWMHAMRGPDGTAARTRFIELFFNQTKPASGRVSYTSYRGIYLLMEKLKRGNERVPLENLNSATVDPELITGGYIIRKDKDDLLKNNWTTPRFGIPLQSFDPDRLNAPQLAYVRNYVAAFETTLNGTNYRNVTNGYPAYIDPDTFIDAQWMLEVAKQVDGYVFSTYFHKNRGGRLRAGPLWDFNISLGNADYATGDTPTGWLYGIPNGVGQSPSWYPKLHQDPEYKLAHWDRYWQMRRTILSTDAVMATINQHMTTLLDGYTGAVGNRAPATIQNPVARHLRKWPRLGIRDWPNPPGETKITTWQAEVDYLKNWIKPRLLWLDDQSMRTARNSLRPPELSHSGGSISEEVELTMQPYFRADPLTTFPQGDIYFTLDNSDPRLPGGDINSTALKYTGPLRIQSSLTANARLYSDRQWSPLATCTFLMRTLPASATNLLISEIMFRPAPLSTGEIAAGFVDVAAFEFLELRNIAKQPVDLARVKFTQGVDFDFSFVPGSARLVKPGESVLLVADKRAFQWRYPHVPPSRIVGQFRGRLDNGGETLAIQAPDLSHLSDFRYDDDLAWPTVGSDFGRSIVLKDPSANPNPADASNWMVSARIGGTPGESGSGADTFAGNPLRDTDGDGQSDLFEFASGSDMENPQSAFFPSAAITVMEVNGARAGYLTLQFRRRPTAQGVKFNIESSEDLSVWNPSGANLVSMASATNRDGTLTDAYRTSVPVNNGSRGSVFYRVKIKQE